MLYPQYQFELVDKKLTRFQEALTRTAIQRKLKKPIADLESKIAKAFGRQGRSLISRLETLKGYFKEAKGLLTDFDNIFEDAISDSSADIMGYIEKAVQTTFLAGATDIIDGLELGISFNLKNPRAVSYLKDYGATQIKNIDSTTRDVIHTILTQAIDEGWSYNRMAGVISDRYKQFAVGLPQQHIASRAHLVAVTEIGNAYQAGNLAAVKGMVDSGLTFEKQWLTVGDNRVSQGCLDNEAAGWIGLDDNFPSGDDRPLRFPGCRCVLQMRRKE